MKVGIEVVTGFLGAGKTAFINSLINEVAIKGEKIIVFQLENGNTLIQEKNKNDYIVKLVAKGCDIKSLKNNIINEILINNPTSIIIEYNGTDKLEDFYSILVSKELRNMCKINTFYYICNGPSCIFYIKNMGELLVPFIESSNLILINNCKSMTDREVSETKKTLENINLNAFILTSEDNCSIQKELRESKLFENEEIKKVKLSVFKYFQNISKKVIR